MGRLAVHVQDILDSLPPPDVNVIPFLWQGLRVFGFLFAVDPLLYIDYASAIIDLEGIVCGLRRDHVDLSDEG